MSDRNESRMKERVLFLEKFLLAQSDEKHPVTTAELINFFEEYDAFQSEIRKLEAYYTSQQWKDDYAMDEAGTFPEKLKRGVLPQDGIWNLLERNRELPRRLGFGDKEE